MSNRWMSTWPYPIREDRGASILSMGLLVFGMALLYALTLSRTIQGGDSGELVAVAYGGGVAHPPGYPLYTLLARASVHLPLLDPVLALSVLSATCGLLTLVFLFLAMRRWDVSIHVAWATVGMFGLSPLFWRYSGVAEVFTLNTLLASLVIWLAGRGRGLSGYVRAAALGLAFGLGLSNHHTILLLLPFVALGLGRGFREARLRRWLVPVLFLAGLALGLSPHAILMGPADAHHWYWGGSMGIGGLVDHVLRRGYGTFSLGHADQSPAFWENPLAYLAHLPRALGLLFPLGLAGVWVGAGSLKGLGQRISASFDILALFSSWVLAGLVFPAAFNLSPGQSGFIVERFYLLPDLLFTLLAAIGLERMLLWQPRIKKVLCEVAVGMLCALVLLNISEADWSHNRAVEDYAFNALDAARPGAVVVGTGDLSLFSLMAVSTVHAHRTDVVYLDLNLIRTEWYHSRMQELLPAVDLPFEPGSTPVEGIVRALLQTRPVYLAGEEVPRTLRERFTLYPLGPLLVVLPPEGQAPPLPQVDELNRELFGTMRHKTGEIPEWNAWGHMAEALYARTWNDIAANYDRRGLTVQADHARALAKPYQPDR